MHEVETILWLLVAVVVLATLSQRVLIPYPIVLVIGGVIIGAVDFLPSVELEPDIVFLVFLPPALFIAAAQTDWQGFRRDMRPIVALAVNLVLTTTVGVAVVGVAVVSGLDWSTAFVLGAIVSPPDAVATLSILKSLPVPRRVMTILEGESLINDATALVAYRFAVAAVVSGSFSIVDAGLEFVWVVLGGVAVGFAVAFVSTWFLRLVMQDTSLSMVTIVLIPIAAYLPAEEIHVSGVLAVVTAGLLFSRFAVHKLTSAARLQITTVSGFISFLIDGLVFILIGLQLPAVLDGLEDRSWATLIGYGAAVAGATIFIRVIWVLFAFEDRRERGGPRRRMSLDLNKPERIAIAWAGPRGVVTLATALALPYTTDAGTPFPERDLIIFLAFCVILATLVGQGLTLPALIRKLKFPEDRAEFEEERLARIATAKAALAKVDEFVGEGWIEPEMADAFRSNYERLLARSRPTDEGADSEAPIPREAIANLFNQIVDAQRMAVRALHEEGQISESVRRKVERSLDLQESARTR
jgi:CPA1 family monovalent cation:H+ antiporter